jgi:hypothetical protein
MLFPRSTQVSVQLALQGGETAILTSNCSDPFRCCAGFIDGDASDPLHQERPVLLQCPTNRAGMEYLFVVSADHLH